MPIADPAVYWNTLWLHIDAYNHVIENRCQLTEEEDEMFTALVEEVYRLSEPINVEELHRYSVPIEEAAEFWGWD